MSARFVAAFVFAWMTSVAAQVPQPFPKPGQPAQPPAAQPQTPAAPQQSAQQPAAVGQLGEPTEATLGVPIYPAAEFIASFDAGRGQRYYLFGTTATYAEIVQYYRNTLRNRGDEVFDNPPIHQFDIGRFREETMAFPPSVSVKDYTTGGTGGYLNPKPGGKPERFPTIIQIVPNPPTVGR
jgi:hypothetical protein